MDEYVWVSNAPMLDEFRQPITTDLFYDDPDRFDECTTKNEAGEPLGRDCFPGEIYWKKPRKNMALHPFFIAGDYPGVDEHAAAILQRHDLGRGALYEVPVRDRRGGTEVGGRYFCLNFGNTKNALLPEVSRNIQKDFYTENLWRPPFVLEDGDLTVSKAALVGPDIWLDPRLRRGFFFSRALGDAIAAARLAKKFFLSKARVV